MDQIKILVVDDESRMRKLVHDFLAKQGYAVLEAEMGKKQWICSFRIRISA